MTLKEWLEKSGKTPFRVAKDLNIRPSNIYMFLGGKRKFGKEVAWSLWNYSGKELDLADLLYEADKE